MPTRTTLTLDDDVAAKLTTEAHKSGRPMRAVVNDALRAGLEKSSAAAREPFQVRASEMGLRPGLSIDHIAGLIEDLEGPSHR